MGPGPGPKLGSMGFNILYKDGHTGLRYGQGQGPIVSSCASLISCPISSPGPVQCAQAISLVILQDFNDVEMISLILMSNTKVIM